MGPGGWGVGGDTHKLSPYFLFSTLEYSRAQSQLFAPVFFFANGHDGAPYGQLCGRQCFTPGPGVKHFGISLLQVARRPQKHGRSRQRQGHTEGAVLQTVDRPELRGYGQYRRNRLVGRAISSPRPHDAPSLVVSVPLASC